MNLFATIRDTFDAIWSPATRILDENKKIIRALTIVTIIFSLASLFLPHLQKDLGSLSWILLLAILFLSPVAKISQSKTLLSLLFFRRDAGILMGVFAIEHALLYFIKFNIEFSSLLNSSFWFKNNNLTYIGWGLLALAIALALLATSNNFSQRLLKTSWKKFQRLTYLLLILVALHIAFIKYDFIKAFIITFIYLVLKIFAETGFHLPATTTLPKYIHP